MVIVEIEGPYPPQTAHTIVGKGDEHQIMIGGGPSSQHQMQQQQQQLAAKYNQRPPKFSAIVNEYMGACLEDHCQIGKISVAQFGFYNHPNDITIRWYKNHVVIKKELKSDINW